MKRSKKMVVLLGVLGAACAVTFGVSRYEEQKEIIKNSDEIILELAADSVTALSWKYEDESLAFHKNDTWVYDEDEAFPVNEEKIQELLELFEAFGVSFVIEDVEDYGQYGLDEPMCTITLKTETDTYELQLGDFSTMDSKRYVSLGDGKVYLVNKDPFDSFELTIRDLILHDELPKFEQVSEIQFAGKQEYQIVYEEDSKNTYCEDDVYFAKQEEKLLPLDTDRVDAYLKTVSGLRLKEYVSYNVTEEELQAYGLDTPELTVTIDHSWEADFDDSKSETTEEMTEGTFILHISRDPEEAAAAQAASDAAADTGKTAENAAGADVSEEEVTAYARVGESQIVYQLTPEQYNSLTAAAYDDLRHQEVLSADFAAIRQIDIRLEDKNYTITTEGDAEKRTYLYDGQELELDAFKDALKALTAERFTDEVPGEKEEISLTAHLENENYPEITIQLYRYDGTSCLAVVNGEPVSFVARSQVVDLIESVYAIILGDGDIQS